MKIRHIKILYILIVIITICCVSVVIYFHDSNEIEETPIPVIQKKEYQRTQIYGFNLNITGDTGKKISIKGDSFSVEKKKIGFLRTSLFNEAILKNGIIDLYSNSVLIVSDEKPKDKITFKNSFSRDTLSSFYDKKISTLKIAPVQINLHQNNTLITSISALSSKVRIKQKDIFFSGKVSIQSGTSKLTTEKLSFNPDDATFQTDTSYELKTDKGDFKGNGFKSNIFLQPIPMENQI